MTFFSDRVQAIPPSGIRVFFDLVTSAKDIVSLGVGEPDFFTPWSIRSDAMYRIEQGMTSYTSNKGLEALRQEISHYVMDRFGVRYSSDELLITNGVSQGVDIIMRSVINPGDEVILPEPTYVCYRPLIELCGGVCVSLNTQPHQFLVTAAEIEKKITPNTKAMVLCYPSNPTGQSIPFSELTAIARLAKEHNILIISDEIYAELSFSDTTSIATIPDIHDQLIYLNGFSKSHAMTGWRIGYIGAPANTIQTINKIHQYAALCAPTVSQYAAIEACKFPKTGIQAMVQSYETRARYFTEKMNQLGLYTIMPAGGLYCFVSIQSTGMTSMAFATALLQKAKVAVVPGCVFGSGGEGYIRACIATDFDQIKHAVRCMEAFMTHHD